MSKQIPGILQKVSERKNMFWKSGLLVAVLSVQIFGTNSANTVSFSFHSIYVKQEAMENFVFPDEIKAKLMKMSKLMNIFYVP